MEKVILVDKKDKQLGTIGKIEAHKKGLLHRAVSVLIFNSNGHILLQKRAKNKYHSGGLWSNAACTHPMPNETIEDAAKKRLLFEMGIDADLSKRTSFIYNAFLDNDMIEHELDYIFFGISDCKPVPNADEVEDYKFISYLNLITEIEQYPEDYTVWFKIILKEAEKEIFKFSNNLIK